MAESSQAGNRPDVITQSHEETGAGDALRILIVEDHPEIRSILKLLLELDGYEVEAAEDGEQAVAMIEFQKSHVAFVDIGLPGIDGYEVARRIRSRRENRDVRLVALTGHGLAEDRARAKEAGFDAHLVKPVEPKELTRILKDHARRFPSPTATDPPHGG